jgi:glycine dehydrogenase subunit 1
MTKPFVHPYIPNSAPEVKEEMLREIGVGSTSELYADIPRDLRLKRRLNLPDGVSEYTVRKNIELTLAKNRAPNELLSFLGAGCWHHYIPAVCDEINGRSEFSTAYDCGETYTDLGRMQAMFEFQSMIGELVDLDVVSVAMYDWPSVCGEAARMAARITGRSELLVPRTIGWERASVIKNYAEDVLKVREVDYEPTSGMLDVDDLKSKISPKTAAVYFENPSYLGFIESQGDTISKVANDNGALSIVGVEPASLGVLKPPGQYGADIVVGEGQPLGVHMNYGGGVMGMIACRDEERLVSEMPTLLLSIADGQHDGEYGFTAYTLPQRIHYFERERGKSFTGTSSVLWAITAAVYLSLLGPQGMRQLGEAIMQKSHYAMKLLSEIDGIRAPAFNSAHFEEFVVNFDGTGKSAIDVNKALLNQGIHGGKVLNTEYPQLGESALYSVTEVHSQEDIEELATKLREVVN